MDGTKVTWKPPDQEIQGNIRRRSVRNQLPDESFAFPKDRKIPLVDQNHVRVALAMFCRTQISDDSDMSADQKRDQAFENIKAAGDHFHQRVDYTRWQDLCIVPKMGSSTS